MSFGKPRQDLQSSAWTTPVGAIAIGLAIGAWGTLLLLLAVALASCELEPASIPRGDTHVVEPPRHRIITGRIEPDEDAGP